MMTYKEYIVGTSPLPKWLQGRLLPYKKMNGETGYEYRYRIKGRFMVAELEAGDSIIRYGNETYINKRGNES